MITKGELTKLLIKNIKEKETLLNDDENKNKANSEINTERTKTKKKSKLKYLSWALVIISTYCEINNHI